MLLFVQDYAIRAAVLRDKVTRLLLYIVTEALQFARMLLFDENPLDVILVYF